MTVGELIEKLEKLSKTDEVKAWDEYDWVSITEVVQIDNKLVGIK